MMLMLRKKKESQNKTDKKIFMPDPVLFIDPVTELIGLYSQFCCSVF